MSSNAQLGWSVNDKEVLQSFQKMQADLDKLKRKNQELADISKRGAKESQQAFSEFGNALNNNISSMKGMVVGLFTIDKVVDIVSAGYQDWINRTTELGTRHEDLNRTVLQTLARTGDLARLAELERMTTPGATQTQFLQAFEGVSLAAPGQTFERRVELGQQVAPLAAAGFNVRELGQAVGNLADAEPSKVADDLADLGVSLRDLLGEDFAAFSSEGMQRALAELRKTSGMTFEQTLGFGVAAADAKVNPKTIESIAVALRKNPKLSLEQLMDNEKLARRVLGEANAEDLALISKESSKSAASELLRAQRDDAARGAVAVLGGSLTGLGMQQTQQLEKARELAAMGPEGRAGKLQASIDAALVASGADYATRTYAANVFRFNRLVGEGPEYAAQQALAGQPYGGIEVTKLLDNIKETNRILMEIKRNQTEGQPAKKINANVEPE